jgi:hypothetical protein
VSPVLHSFSPSFFLFSHWQCFFHPHLPNFKLSFLQDLSLFETNIFAIVSYLCSCIPSSQFSFYALLLVEILTDSSFLSFHPLYFQLPEGVIESMVMVSLNTSSLPFSTFSHLLFFCLSSVSPAPQLFPMIISLKATPF